MKVSVERMHWINHEFKYFRFGGRHLGFPTYRLLHTSDCSPATFFYFAEPQTTKVTAISNEKTGDATQQVSLMDLYSMFSIF
jgi:hypothetical protein